MPPVLPHALANGQVVDLDKIQADLQAIAAYLSGNALGSDFLALSIPNSRLANKYVPISVVDRITPPGLHGNDPDTGSWYVGNIPPELLLAAFDGYGANLTMYRAPCAFTLETIWCQNFSGDTGGKCQLWRKPLAGAFAPLAGTILDIIDTDPLVANNNLTTGLSLSISEGSLLAWRTDADGGTMHAGRLPLVVGFSGKAELQA